MQYRSSTRVSKEGSVIFRLVPWTANPSKLYSFFQECNLLLIESILFNFCVRLKEGGEGVGWRMGLRTGSVGDSKSFSHNIKLQLSTQQQSVTLKMCIANVGLHTCCLCIKDPFSLTIRKCWKMSFVMCKVTIWHVLKGMSLISHRTNSSGAKTPVSTVALNY